jgi:hypothetical protein
LTAFGSGRSVTAPFLQSAEQPAQSTLVLRLGQLPTPLIDQPLALRALEECADALGESRHRSASSNRELDTYPPTERYNPGEVLRPRTRAATAKA